jgi:hypothetical protein
MTRRRVTTVQQHCNNSVTTVWQQRYFNSVRAPGVEVPDREGEYEGEAAGSGRNPPPVAQRLVPAPPQLLSKRGEESGRTGGGGSCK